MREIAVALLNIPACIFESSLHGRLHCNQAKVRGQTGNMSACPYNVQQSTSFKANY